MATGNSAQGDAASKREKALEKLKIEIRSILITARGCGVDEMQRDFEDLNGYPIPARDLGFRDLKDLIQSMPDVVEVSRENGMVKLYAKSHESTRRIESLIQRTRSSRVTRFGGTEQHQPSAEQLRIANERKRIIKERMIQIASRTNGFIAYGDLRRRYRATFGEDFDPKRDFKCPPKVVFSTKWNRHFIVTGRGGPLNFQVRLRETSGTESQGGASGFAGAASRSSGQQSYGSSYSTNQNRPPPGNNTFGGSQTSNDSAMKRQQAFSGDIPPRFRTPPQQSGAMASSNYQAQFASRFGGSTAENMARPSGQAQTSASMQPMSKSTSAYAPLSVTVSSTSTGQSMRSISAVPPTTLQEREQARVQASPQAYYMRQSTAALKNRITELLSTYSNGIELSMFKNAYYYHFKQECGVEIEFLRQCCSDICELEWNEGSLRYYVKPKEPIKDPLFSMASVVAALPAVSSRSGPQSSLVTPPPPASMPSTSSAAPASSVRAPPLSWSDLKKNLRQVLQKHPSGISYLAFPKAYRAVTGRELDLEPYKLWSLTELIETLPNLFLTLKRNGEVMLYDAGEDQSLSSLSPPDIVENMEHLADEIWVVVMNAPNHSLLLSKIPESYQSTFGKPIPVKEFEGDVSVKLFDFTDRFEFVYQGVVYVSAVPEYKPSDNVIRYLVGKKEEPNVAAASLLTDHVLFGEKYVAQTLPEGVIQLISLDDVEPNRQFEVLVAQVDSPARFFVQLRSTYDELATLVGEMSDFYVGASKAALVPAVEIQVGMPCACCYEEDGLWYRSLIKAVTGDQIMVSLVDFGTEVAIPVGAVYYLARQFFSFPAQAIECCLAFLSPPNDTWPIEAGEIMAQFCGSSVLTADLIKVEAGVLHIYLAKNFEDGTDTYLSDVLLDANLAVFNEGDGRETANSYSGAADVGNLDEIEEETGSGADNGSVVSFRTATEDDPNLVDVSTPFSTPFGMDSELEAIMDLTFEEDVINQLRSGDLNDADSEVVNLANIILRRKWLALRKKLSGGSSEVNDIIVDKVSWLEQQIHWLTEQVNKLESA